MVKQFNKAKISITVDQEIIDVIERKAAEDDRSLSSMINIVLRDYVKSLEKEGK